MALSSRQKRAGAAAAHQGARNKIALPPRVILKASRGDVDRKVVTEVFLAVDAGERLPVFWPMTTLRAAA